MSYEPSSTSSFAYFVLLECGKKCQINHSIGHDLVCLSVQLDSFIHTLYIIIHIKNYVTLA